LSDASQPTNVWTTNYTLTGTGNVVSAAIADGHSRTVSYIADVNGQVLRRDEPIAYNLQYELDPHDIWYRFAGREMGHV